jgi:hypothetical protein
MPAKLLRVASAETPRQTAPAWPVGIAVLAVLAVLLLLWAWSESSDARVIARMAPADRATLFQVTRNKAEVVCGNPELEEQCHAEIDLLSKFPECGAECRDFVAVHRPHGSR